MARMKGSHGYFEQRGRILNVSARTGGLRAATIATTPLPMPADRCETLRKEP
jgi:hypothetical protein